MDQEILVQGYVESGQTLGFDTLKVVRYAAKVLDRQCSATQLLLRWLLADLSGPR